MAGTVITKKGLQLIAKLVASGTALTFTRASVGTGSVPAGYDPGSMTNLNNYKMDGSISSCSASGDEASIIMQISSLGVDTGFTITETGLFATDPDEGEILYAYLDLSKDPQYVYAENSAISKFVEITLVVKVGTVDKVTAYINPGSLLTHDGDVSETVVNTLEPIETKFPIPSAGESIKRFLGNVRTCLKNIKPLEANVSVYVATTGSDTTGDGSETAPYRTIPYALSTIPKDLGGYTATFIVADGTYNEPVNIIGYCGGYIILKRNGSQELNSDCNINSIRVEYCDSVSVSGFNLVNSEGTSVFANMCKFVNMAYCQSIVATETDEVSFNFDYVAVGRITGCRSLNHNMCLRSYSSDVTSHSWSDDSQGNYGIFSDGGGRVAKGNVFQPKGLLANEVHPGGGINVNHFGASIGTLGYELTLYVSTTGSDTTGNGTQAKPFRTIQHAIDIIPKDLNGYRAVIEVAAGTYDEHVYISSFNGGRIAINSDSKNTLTGSCSVKSISVKFCSAYVYLNGFNLTYAEDAVIVVWGCQHVIAVCCQSTVSARTKAGIYIGESRARINYCRIANRNVALQTVDSAVTSETWDQAGSINNDYGLSASYSATIHKIGAQPTGLAANEARGTSGTFINEHGTQISNLIETNLSCTWGIRTSGYVRIGNIKYGDAIVVVNLRIEVTANLTAGTQYFITGFPPPIGTLSSVAVTTDCPSRTRVCYMNTEGTIIFVPSENMNAGTIAPCFSASYKTNS